MALDNAFGLNNTDALTKSVEEKCVLPPLPTLLRTREIIILSLVLTQKRKTRVNDQNAELEALEARLKAMEAQLKEKKPNKAAAAGPSGSNVPKQQQNASRVVNGQRSGPLQPYQNRSFTGQQNLRQSENPTAKHAGSAAPRPVKTQQASDEEEDSDEEEEDDDEEEEEDDDDEDDEDDSETEDSSEEEEEETK